MTRRRLLAAVSVLLLAVLVLPWRPATAEDYPCALLRSWTDGQRLTGADLTNSLRRAMQTNMVWSCLDDLSATATDMQTTRDPYPGSAISLPTTGAGELQGIRHVLKSLTGWSQWYAHTENLNLGARNLTTTGTIASGPVTDVSLFYPATSRCQPSVSLVPNRIAANDWALIRVASGAETVHVRCDLERPYRTTSGKGWKLTAFSIVQQITGVDLTSNTFNGLQTTTYANNVANAVAAYGGSITITMPTAVQANPYVTAGTVGTAAFMNTATTAVGVDFTVVLQSGSVYRLYGIGATWTEQN